MTAKPAARPTLRTQRRTVLLVGEGHAEQQFLLHLKALYVVRGSKSVTIKNAKGKGGRHVLTYTLRQGKQAAYDQMGTLLDTDTDWDAREQARARRGRVQVFESTPCLEALLLRIAGYGVPSGDTLTVKRAFSQRFSDPAHAPRVYEQFFDLAVLNTARARIDVLANLLRFLES